MGFQCVENGLDLGVQGRWVGGDDAVEVDGGRAQRFEGAQESPQREPGAGLDFAADGQCGEHDRQVGFDDVAGAGEHGSGGEVGLGHPEGRLHVP